MVDKRITIFTANFMEYTDNFYETLVKLCDNYHLSKVNVVKSYLDDSYNSNSIIKQHEIICLPTILFETIETNGDKKLTKSIKITGVSEYSEIEKIIKIFIK